jgi:hypothetical protein
MLQIVTFHSMEGGAAIYDHDGQPSSLWVTGTHIYGMVVIMANTRIWNSTSNHTIFSNLVIFGSIGSFYLAVFTMSQFKLFNVLVGLFFLLVTAFTDQLLYWSNLRMTYQKEHKQEEQAMLLQYKRAQDSAMIRKRGARSAIATAHGGQDPAGGAAGHGGHGPMYPGFVDYMVDLGEWQSNDGGSFSSYDSDEEIRRLKRYRRRLHAKKEEKEKGKKKV